MTRVWVEVDGNAYSLEEWKGRTLLVSCPVSKDGDILCNEDEQVQVDLEMIDADQAGECRQIQRALEAAVKAWEAVANPRHCPKCDCTLTDPETLRCPACGASTVEDAE